MKEESKKRLHKFLTGIYYSAVIINFLLPLTLAIISGIALTQLRNSHWSTKWTVFFMFGLSVIEFISQTRKTIKELNAHNIEK